MTKYQSYLRSFQIKGNYPKGKIEKSFQKEFFGILRKDNWECYHIPDVGLGYKFLDAVCISPGGDTVYIEFKKTEGYTFNFNQYERSQTLLLRKLATRPNCEAYTCIHSVKTNTYAIHAFDELVAMKNAKGGCKLFN